MAFPMVWGIFSVIGFNFVDTYFVSRLGTLELTALSFIFPVVFFYSGLAVGMGVGVSSLVSQAIGANDKQKACRLTTDALLLALILVVFFIFFGLVTMRPLFTLMGATSEVYNIIEVYMNVWFWGMPFVVIPMVGNGAIRALGDTLRPSLIMIVAGVSNAVLDYMLIFGHWGAPAMGVKGAALATVLSRGLTFIFAFYFLAYRYKLLAYNLKNTEHFSLAQSWKSLTGLSLASGLSNALAPVSIGIITAVMSTYGLKAVGAYGIVSRIQSLTMVIIFALASVLPPFVGQNLGAKKHGRILRVLEISTQYSFIWSLGAGLFFLFWGRNVIFLFSQDEQILEYGVFYLCWVPWFYSAEAIRLIGGHFFNGAGRTVDMLKLHLTRQFFLSIPLAILMGHAWGAKGVLISEALSYLLGSVQAIWMLSIYLKKIGLSFDRLLIERKA